ncbi:DedA family protein [Candidatus Woesearchaeota archaeon]|nr:DedA family protein [Candidatus Woesearchaeota archaeon]
MLFITRALSAIGHLATQTISTLGYFGVFFLMMLESMIAPVPSELVMPFAGFLVTRGEFSFYLVIICSSLGSLIGSLISYYIGKYGGEAVVLRYGRYLLLDQHDLQRTQSWFNKKGEITVLISRFIPVVRHLISIPAGTGRMNLKKFCVYTLIGATLWNTFLAYLGLKLGENWAMVRQYSEYISVPTAIIILIVGLYLIYRHICHKKRSSELP